MQKKLALLLSLAVMAGGFVACDDSDDDSQTSCTANVCNANVLSICSGGKFVTTYVCENGCLNGACISTPEPALNCSEGSKQCSSAGVPQICANNTWVDNVACAANQVCKDGACVDNTTPQPSVCTDGAKQCSTAGVPQVCAGNVWYDQTACAANMVCQNGECVSSSDPQPSVCSDGAVQCSQDGIPQICSQNVWFDQTPCGDGTECQNGSCLPVSIPTCTDGEKSCSSNGIPLVCVEGVQVEQAACADNLVCSGGECVDPGTVVCQEGAVQCSTDGVPQKCISNAWVDQTACDAGESCVNGICTAPSTCDDGKTEVNGVCVPNEMLNAADGAPCDKSWDVEFCNKDGNAVYCATDDEENLFLVIEPCSSGCKLADMSSENEVYYSSICDNSYSSQCTSTEDSFGFCVDEDEYSFESAYMCMNAVGGGYIAVDISIFGYGDVCEGVCNTDKTACASNETTCTTDSDCKTGESCVDGVCKVEGSCKADSDCSGQTPYCDTYFGLCAPCIGGDASKGCLDTSKVCSMDPETWEFVCVEPSTGCKTDADCKDGEACVDSQCVTVEPECSADSDCEDGYACVEGVCVQSVPECSADSDCEDGYACVEGVCVQSVPECSADSDCEDGYACVEGVCVAAGSFDVVRSVVLPGDFKSTKDAYSQKAEGEVNGVKFIGIGNLNNDKGLVMTNRNGIDSRFEVSSATGIGTVKLSVQRWSEKETGIYYVIVNDDESTKQSFDLKSLSSTEAKVLSFKFDNAAAKSFKVVPASYQTSNKYRIFLSKVEWTSIK